MKLSFFKSPNVSILLKLAFVGFLLLILMIPNGMIKGLIYERSGYESEVKRDVAATWGNQQVLIGPLLTIPCTVRKSHVVNGETKTYTVTKHYHTIPSMLDVKSQMETTSLKKSIYDIWLFTSEMTFTGEFTMDRIEVSDLETVHWDQAILTLGMSDAHGLEGNINATLDGKSIEFEPGSLVSGVFPRGVSATINLEEGKSFAFSIACKLRGSESLNFIPIAEESRVEINSDWHSPGFIGVLSPSQREVSDAGFRVVWESGKFTKDNPDNWFDTAFTFMDYSHGSFGVELVEPVNHYQKNTRSAKYSFLILGLTFLVFFFFEVGNGLRVHPIQYLLVGLSLTVFYLLLLSLTEHIGFDKAYIVAAIATLASTVMYARSFFQSTKQSVIFLFILVLLYIYIFVLLQLEGYALLAGAIGVFIILCIVMYLTRSIDYYQLGEGDEA